MFDYKHYVPVLRWKQAEWMALQTIEPKYKKFLTPLLEFPPFKYGKFDKKIWDKALSDINTCWGNSPIFCDLDLLSNSPDLINILLEIENQSENLSLSIIFVTSINMPSTYQNALKDILKKDQRGIAIRLYPKDLVNRNLTFELNNIIDLLNINSEYVDLIIDHKLIDDLNIKRPTINTILPDLTEWRSLTFLSGAFPKDLTNFKPGQHLYPRFDWLAWVNELEMLKGLRLPYFGDYTIQHSFFYEPPRRANFSASIRYATIKDWVIMRGEGVFNNNSPGFAQYPANAQLLCERSEFCGRDFSIGDRYIYDMGNQLCNTTGSARTWLSAGINHHITFVVNQISNLVVF